MIPSFLEDFETPTQYQSATVLPMQAVIWITAVGQSPASVRKEIIADEIAAFHDKADTLLEQIEAGAPIKELVALRDELQSDYNANSNLKQFEEVLRTVDHAAERMGVDW